MAHIHVLTGDGKREWIVIFHFAVPDIVNAVGVNYRTALANSDLGGSTQMVEGDGPGQISAVEKAAVEAGEVCEQRISFKAEGDGTDVAAVQRMLRRKYGRESTLVLDKLQVQLKYFGHTESEN